MSYKKDIEREFGWYEYFQRELGLIPDGYRLILNHGNQSAGIAWKVALTGVAIQDPATGAYSYPNGTGESCDALGHDLLGTTQRQAYERLHGMVSTLRGICRTSVVTTGIFGRQ
jgi:hypothetical protein